MKGTDGSLHVMMPYLLKMRCTFMAINFGNSVDIQIYAKYGNTNYRFEFIGRKEGLGCIFYIHDNLDVFFQNT